MNAAIVGIEYYLPETVLTTKDLSLMFPEWAVEKIDAKTGIHARHIAAAGECASDLAVAAVHKLFASGICAPEQIDFLLFCTQSPDYILPTTACLLQNRLNLPRDAGALDVNLGCSGFVYALGIAEGLIATGQARALLLITADTYSKYLDKNDRVSRTVFGDGAAATFIQACEDKQGQFGPFVYGTNGQGADDLIVRNSGTRRSRDISSSGNAKDDGDKEADMVLSMNGSRIFTFALTVVPRAVQSLLCKAGMTIDNVDLFIFHQANAYMLEELRRLCGIPKNKFQITMAHCANTVSSTIPIALKHATSERQLQKGAPVMLVGFGVGYSWAATIIRWANL